MTSLLQRILPLFGALLFLNQGFAQNFRTITSLPSIVKETSGIEITDPNEIWTFNDSGGEAALYLCDTLGNLLRTVTVGNAWNRDWEDITQDDEGNFYIGNIGNNSNANTDLTIFKIPNPATVQEDSVTAEVISFAYEDQFSFPPPGDSLHFDCEALMWYNNHLYLATKNRTNPFDGITHLYRLPATPGQHIAEKISTFDTGGGIMLTYWITAGDISPDGSKLCLLSSDKMWIFYDFSGDDFFNGQYLQVDFPGGTQKEAVCFVSERELYITDEKIGGILGGNLYAVSIDGLITNTEERPEADHTFSVFPNPFRDRLVIEGDLKDCYLEILGLNGVLQTVSPVTNTLEINTSRLANGVFFVRIVNRRTGEVYRQKIEKVK